MSNELVSVNSAGGGIHCDRCGYTRLRGTKCPHCNKESDGFIN